jgi:hypothetical protein
MPDRDGNEMSTTDQRRYCVLGWDARDRQWFSSEEDAVAHGKNILRGQSHKVNAKELVVVEAIKVIRPARPVPPIEVLEIEDYYDR